MITRKYLAFAGAVLLTAASLHAQSYTEIGDAGQTLDTAQNTGVAGTSLTSIFGSISSPTDADLFRINITEPTTFSASTVNGTTLDTALFLFSSSGAPIYANDDANGLTLQSTLPAGTSFTMSLSPGIYFLGISLAGNEPINLNNQFLFAADNGDTTTVRGPAGSISPNALSDFNGQTSFSGQGTYQITLTSTAAVPEPSTWALLALGLTAIILLSARRRHRNCER